MILTADLRCPDGHWKVNGSASHSLFFALAAASSSSCISLAALSLSLGGALSPCEPIPLPLILSDPRLLFCLPPLEPVDQPDALP